MTYQYLTIRRDGAVEHVTLNRPDVRNAFNEAVIAELSAWAASAREDEGLRVVVFGGAGKVFSAGADAEWMSRMAGYSQAENVADARAAASMFRAINALPCAVIGRIHGAALGGGSGLAAVCDIVVAAENTIFGFTETKLGILPAMISPFVLPKIGVSAARELFLTGMRFSAARAREIGLVHSVVAEEHLDDAVQRYVTELLSASPSGIAAAKALIPQVWGQRPETVADLTAQTIAAQRGSDEGREGLRAFLEKRSPAWVPK
ncbi:MAG: enoyl-CoA hydratase/isomerase family protein [Acidobacteria bacterium]|nr:enoyl-CoA hydratase/isomerase family protein [Acidobacteriota bacterium]